LGAMAALFVGCGDGSETTEAREGEPRAEVCPKAEERPGKPGKMYFGIDGTPSPQNVGVLMAGRKGYLSEAGVESWVRTPVGPFRPIPYVAEEIVDLSVSHLPEVVLARERGVPVVAVASLVPQPTAAMIWLEKSKIDGIAGLEGKTIAIPGVSFQKRFLEVMLAQADLTLADVEVVYGGYDLVPALASGRVDAIFGGSGNVEGAELRARGLEPIVTGVQSFGIPAYDELVVIVRCDRLAAEPQSVRKILAAVDRGTETAVKDPAEAVEAIFDEAFEPDRSGIEKGVEATLPLLSTSGRIDPERADRLVDWMLAEGMIQRPLPSSALLTNDYLTAAP